MGQGTGAGMGTGIGAGIGAGIIRRGAGPPPWLLSYAYAHHPENFIHTLIYTHADDTIDLY